MAKMKISGAKPSQPPAPIVCSANKFAMCIDPEMELTLNNPEARPVWRFEALCNFPQDFSFPQAGDSLATGMNRGCQAMVSLGSAPRKEIGPYSQAQ